MLSTVYNKIILNYAYLIVLVHFPALENIFSPDLIDIMLFTISSFDCIIKIKFY